MATKDSIDTIYRAAIMAAGDIDSESSPTRLTAAVSLAAALERYGVDVQWPDSKSNAKPAGVFAVSGDGVVISVNEDDRASDWTSYGKQQHWQRLHLVNFAPRTLTVRTVTI